MCIANSQTIFIADDEADLLHLVERALLKEGFKVETASTGRAALEGVKAIVPDLAILDMMMPEMTGVEVCRALRAQPATAEIPLIMLSARTAEIDRVVAFEVGVDDYVTKPFSSRELLLRVRAILRHAPSVRHQNGVWTLGQISLDRERHQVKVNGVEVALTAVEFKLLRVLLQTPERVHSRTALLESVWGDDRVELRTVDTQVRRLRARLGPAANQIETIRAFGYRLTSPREIA